MRASYGYDAYGGQEAPDSDTQSLTTGDPDNQTPLNPFRFSAERMDSGTATSPAGTATLDMGARRFGPNTGRFQQPDVYFGALSNLGLSTDPLTQNRYSLAGANPVSFMELDGHLTIPDGSGGSAEAPSVIGAAAAPQPYQEPAPEPEPEPNVLQKAWNNTKDLVGGGASGAVDAGQGMWQLGYDTFYGPSPFADEQTQAETKARAQARGDLIKNPGKLLDAVKAPYEQDINSGHDGRAAGRAVFDILTIIGTGGLTKTGTAARAASTTARTAARTHEVVSVPGGLKLPGVPKGASGVPVDTGKGLQYTIPRGTPELDPRVTGIRVMDPVTTGKYQYPNGYVAYMNEAGQTVNPLTGRTVLPSDPFAHIAPA